MAARTSNRTHVEDLFQPNGHVQGHSERRPFSEKNGGKQEKIVFKNKLAPKPPGGMPKIGNYKPKILHEMESAGSKQPTYRKIEPVSVTSHTSNHEEFGRLDDSKPLIIGDKHVPLHIENHAFEDDPEEMPVPKPRRKRRAPSAPTADQEADGGQTTDNPLFGNTSAANTTMPSAADDFETQEGVIDFGPSLSEDSGIASPQTKREAPKPPTLLETNDDGKDYPYIPPPDYDDEEITMDFGEEVETLNQRNLLNGRSLYGVVEGEDFGKYLEDDDPGFDSPGQNWRPRPIKHAPHPPKRYDKRFSKPNKKRNDQKRNTIRDFSFSDSKIGWGDRTVKSTSAKGRYIKREKERKRIDQIERFDKGPDYQDFLQGRIGGHTVDTSPQSSDSGLGEGEDGMRDPRVYLHSQPRQMAGEHGHHRKSSIFQKLTWKFKKGLNISHHHESR